MKGSGWGLAFFSYISGATIKNLNVEADVTSAWTGTYVYAAAIAGYANGEFSIENCSFKGTLKAGPASGTSTGDSGNYLGGIVAYSPWTAEGKISSCSVEGTLESTGTTSNSNFTGGILGSVDLGGKMDISDCTVSATIKGGNSTASSVCTAGIAAVLYGSVTNCTVKDSAITGGNSGINSGNSSTGGIAANIYTGVTITGCKVQGTTTVTGGDCELNISTTGALVAAANDKTCAISGCEVDSGVSVIGGKGKNNYAGGLIARNYGTIHTSSTAASVTAGTGDNTYTGGFAGWTHSTTGLIYSCNSCTATVGGSAVNSGNVVGNVNPFTPATCTEGSHSDNWNVGS